MTEITRAIIGYPHIFAPILNLLSKSVILKNKKNKNPMIIFSEMLNSD